MPDIDKRAFSFFNCMLDIVMHLEYSPSKPRHSTSLGAELLIVVNGAFAFMRSEFTESGNAEHALDGVSNSDRIMAAARLHILADNIEQDGVFRRAVFWHWANLEYGCSADLHQVRVRSFRQFLFLPL